MTKRKVIAVFGSSNPPPGSPDYQAAYEAGRLLAARGYAVMTGGYGGVMAAASQGAAEAGGHVIGITCEQLEDWRPLAPNQWITEEVRHASLSDRGHHIVKHTNGAIAMPGGVGTLAEIAQSWSLLQTGEIAAKPLVLVGTLWRATFETMLENSNNYMSPESKALIQFAATAAAAVELIAAAVKIA